MSYLSYAARKREDRRAQRRMQGLEDKFPRRQRRSRYDPDQGRKDLLALTKKSQQQAVEEAMKGLSTSMVSLEERPPLADIISKSSNRENMVTISDEQIDNLKPIKGVFGGIYAPRVHKQKSLYTLSSDSDFDDEEEQQRNKKHSEVSLDSRRASREQVLVVAANEDDEEIKDEHIDDSSKTRLSAGRTASSIKSKLKHSSGEEDLEFPESNNSEDNEIANNQLLHKILERLESTTFEDEPKDESNAKKEEDLSTPEDEFYQDQKDDFHADSVSNEGPTHTAANISTASLAPPPPTPDQHKYRQQKNSKAVKNKARERQRMRAKRNTLGINRLRRSSILPAMRMSLSVKENPVASVLEPKLEFTSSIRRSSIFGGEIQEVPSTPKHRGRGFNRRDSLLESLPGSHKRLSAAYGLRRRQRSGIKPVPGVRRRSSALKSTLQPQGKNNYSTKPRFSSFQSSLDEVRSTDTQSMTTEDSERETIVELKSIFTKHGSFGMQEVFEAEAEGDEDILSSSSDEEGGTDFDPTVTVDLATAAAAETQTLMMILKLVFEFLPVRDLKTSTLFVSPTWHRSSVSALSWYIGTTVASSTRSFADDIDPSLQSSAALYRMRVSFAETFPWGRFLCRGGYKSVYKVWCAPRKRLEAVSVMDVDLISHGHNEHIVRQEVHVGTLLSDLVTSGESVNFIETFGMFHSTMEEPLDLWGSEDRKEPLPWIKFKDSGYKSSQLTKLKKRKEGFFCAGAGRLDEEDGSEEESMGSYCYIRMELCDGGDMEDFLRDEKNAPGGVIPVQECVGALYQMIHALDLAQRKFALRHYDVKLLNFFLKKADVATQSCQEDGKADPQKIVEVARYVEESKNSMDGGVSSIVIRAPACRAYIVKLADYGTADIDITSLGMPILADNFATLENSPPDFLLLGNGGATQSFAADVFALGLSALHMFTGSMPYEEILEEVECPVKLRRDLTKIWTKDPGYSAVGSIVDDETTLHDTLYRFFVLFGFPKQEMVGGLYNYNANPVLRAVAKCFRFRKSTTEGRGKGWKKFCEQRRKFGLFDGDSTLAFSECMYIQRARERMAEVPGMEKLLSQMLHYDPSRRIMMEGALRSPVFDCLRE